MELNGHKMYAWATDLYPLNRSLTGAGVRETLKYVKNILPGLNVKEVPTGYQAFDWLVPNEWFIDDAWIENEEGIRIVDFKNHNLHVLGYSSPVDAYFSKEELLKHIYSLPGQPDTIPYVTSYYKERWGFCMTHKQRESLPDGQYKAVIKSQLKEGVLNYADIIIPGNSAEEILFSTYICHPSMANNELSGLVVAVALASFLSRQKSLKYTYRFVFVPETIGSIVYLSKHLNHLKENVRAGFVLTCVGDERTWSFLPSPRGDTLADKVATYVLKDKKIDYTPYSFLDRGSDERQYCSPRVGLPVVSVMRSKYSTYPEYHTSGDNMDFITAKGLEDSFNFYKQVIKVLENNCYPVSTVFCEPQLGKRGLYPDLSIKGSKKHVKKMMHIIAYSDGSMDTMDLFKKVGVDFETGIKIVNTLKEHHLLENKCNLDLMENPSIVNREKQLLC